MQSVPITTHWCLWVWISIRARCIPLCDKVCQWLATGRWFSPGPSVSSTNKTDRHDITEIFLKVALNTIKQTNINDSDWNNCVLLVLCEFGCDICNIKLSKLLISFHCIFIKKFQKLCFSLNGLLICRTEKSNIKGKTFDFLRNKENFFFEN
jgi:hypothetical protein